MAYSNLDLTRANYVLYGVKYIDLVSLLRHIVFAGHRASLSFLFSMPHEVFQFTRARLSCTIESLTGWAKLIKLCELLASRFSPPPFDAFGMNTLDGTTSSTTSSTISSTTSGNAAPTAFAGTSSFTVMCDPIFLSVLSYLSNGLAYLPIKRWCAGLSSYQTLVCWPIFLSNVGALAYLPIKRWCAGLSSYQALVSSNQTLVSSNQTLVSSNQTLMR